MYFYYLVDVLVSNIFAYLDLESTGWSFLWVKLLFRFITQNHPLDVFFKSNWHLTVMCQLLFISVFYFFYLSPAFDICQLLSLSVNYFLYLSTTFHICQLLFISVNYFFYLSTTFYICQKTFNIFQLSFIVPLIFVTFSCLQPTYHY